MNLPINVFEGNDLSIYETGEISIYDKVWMDVEEGEYVCFDAGGVEVSLHPSDRKGVNAYDLVALEPNRSEFVRRLKQAIAAVMRVEVGDVDFEDLKRMASAFFEQAVAAITADRPSRPARRPRNRGGPDRSPTRFLRNQWQRLLVDRANRCRP